MTRTTVYLGRSDGDARGEILADVYHSMPGGEPVDTPLEVTFTSGAGEPIRFGAMDPHDVFINGFVTETPDEFEPNTFGVFCNGEAVACGRLEETVAEAIAIDSGSGGRIAIPPGQAPDIHLTGEVAE